MPLRRFVTAAETDKDQLPGQLNNWYFKDGTGGTDQIALVRACLQPGAGHAFHNHPEMDEIIYVLRGQLEQWLEKESRILKAGDTLYIPRGVVHASYNVSGAECEFLAILSPGKITGPLAVDHSTEEPWCSLK